MPKLRPIEDGSVAIVRSFAASVSDKLGAAFPVTTLGTVEYGPHRYPIYRLCTWRAFDPHKPTILLSGAVHGDEPAGALALVEFLAMLQNGSPWLSTHQFVIYPCVNPSGFEANTLKTMPATTVGLRRRKNLNRLFGTAKPPREIQLIQNDLAQLNIQFRFAMDMHEAPPYYVGEGYTRKDNPHACWIYETQRDPALRIGRHIMDSLPEGVVACDWPTIYDDRNDRGVIAFLPETTGNAVYAQCTSFDGYVFERYTQHSFTTETPTGWSLDTRIKAHIHFLTRALEETNRK
jgi:hypothetical protein